MAARAYRGSGIVIHWNPERCIHSARCVEGLPQVFDSSRRPWIEPAGAQADEIAAVIEQCPTGALRYERLDGGADEQPEVPTQIVPLPNGPLVVRGALRVQTPDGEVLVEETRLALCRCGQTANQPFCDNSHLRTGFASGASDARPRTGAAPTSATGETITTIVPTRDGPLRLRGALRLQTLEGELLGETDELVLCRCGRSASKPLCDNSHKVAGFQSTKGRCPDERRRADSPAAFQRNEQFDHGAA